MKKVLLAATVLALTAGFGFANQSANSARKCGGTGLNQGQAFQLPGLAGGPAAGPDKTQTPKDFAERLNAESVGKLLKRDCIIVKKNPS